MTARQMILMTITLAGGFCFAQFRPRPGTTPRSQTSDHFIRIEGGLIVNEDEIHTARETDTHSSGTPNWTNAPGFEQDVFTFTRIIFQSDPAPRSSRGRFAGSVGGWIILMLTSIFPTGCSNSR